jgi:hypothetical protein
MNEHVSLEIQDHISENYSAISEEEIYLFRYTRLTGHSMQP